MSGEIPTEQPELAKVTSAVAFARNLLVGDVSFGPHPQDIDLSLIEAYVTVGSLFSIRGRSEELSAAVQAAAEEAARDARVRTELLEKYGIGSDTEATDIIAGYWQGEQPGNLAECIRGTYSTEEDIETFRRAWQFAELGTADDSDSRQAVDNAQRLLWRNHTR